MASGTPPAVAVTPSLADRLAHTQPNMGPATPTIQPLRPMLQMSSGSAPSNSHAKGRSPSVPSRQQTVDRLRERMAPLGRNGQAAHAVPAAAQQQMLKSGNVDPADGMQLLQTLLEAERCERAAGMEALRKDLDSQQKVLTEVTKQLISLKAASVQPSVQKQASGDEQSLLQNASQDTEQPAAQGEQQRLMDKRVTKLEETLADLQEEQRAEALLNACASELRSGVATGFNGSDASTFKALATPGRRNSDTGLLELQKGQSAQSSAASMTAEKVAAASAGGDIAAVSSKNVDALMEATTDLARLLGVERESRHGGMVELAGKFAHDLGSSVRLIEKRSSEFKAMFVAQTGINDKKFSKIRTETREMWDVLEVRVRELAAHPELRQGGTFTDGNITPNKKVLVHYNDDDDKISPATGGTS